MKYISFIKNIILKNLLLTITFLIFLLTLIILPFDIKILNSVDLRVIEALFCMMIIGAAAEKEGLLDLAALNLVEKCSNHRRLSLVLSLITAVFAMLITNDIALIIIVPIILKISESLNFDPFKTVTLVTVSANLGSSLLPMGNPQNIFIYNYFNTSPLQFIKVALPICLIGALLVFIVSLNIKGLPLENIHISKKVLNYKKVLLYTGLFALFVLGIFRVLDLNIVTPVIILSFLIVDRKLFKKVDYSLLLIFVFFFMIIFNISKVDNLKAIANSHINGYLEIILSSALLSQVISNVPTAILISPFANSFEPVLIGVSIGGLGTMIASLANLISYKLYIEKYPSKKYFAYFTKVNFAMLFIFIAIYFLSYKVLA